jgi:hypothetical protein
MKTSVIVLNELEKNKALAAIGARRQQNNNNKTTTTTTRLFECEIVAGSE